MPEVNLMLDIDKKETVVNERSEKINATAVLDVKKEFIKRPTLMMEYDSSEITFDVKAETNSNWVLDKPCPNVDSCGSNYLNRKCVYRSQGFDLTATDEPFENQVAFDVHATGDKSDLHLVSRIISCGECIPLNKCNKKNSNDKECATTIKAVSQPLINDTQISVRVYPSWGNYIILIFIQGKSETSELCCDGERSG